MAMYTIFSMFLELSAGWENHLLYVHLLLAGVVLCTHWLSPTKASGPGLQLRLKQASSS